MLHRGLTQIAGMMRGFCLGAVVGFLLGVARLLLTDVEGMEAGFCFVAVIICWMPIGGVIGAAVGFMTAKKGA